MHLIIGSKITPKKGQKRVKNDPLITKGTPLKYPQNAPFFRENVPQKVRFSHFSFNAPYPVGGGSFPAYHGGISWFPLAHPNGEVYIHKFD